MASYVTKIGAFVDWPPATFADAASPFTICLAGKDNFGSSIDEIAHGQRLRGRPVKVRRLGEDSTADDCQIMFVGEDSPATLSNQVAGKPVLTVSEKGSDPRVSMVTFLRQAGRVRFEIDNGAARAAHLSISSKLLALAVTVNQ